jgi:multiple sugar transport system permease protein
MADSAPVVRRRAGNRGNIVVHVVLSTGALLMVGPFIWEILTSVKTFAEASAVPPVFFPAVLQFGNYSDVFDTLPFAAQFGNSVLMTLLRTAGQVLFCSCAGYAFARVQFPGKNVIFVLFLSVLMIPSQLFLLSQYEIIQGLGLLNTVTALALPGVFSAFGTFLMRQFYLQLPAELEEAARLDGANVIQTFFRIMLPLSANGLLALGVLTAIWSWNDLLWPLIVNTDPEKMPLSAGLSSLQGQHLTNYPVLMAGSLLASLPMIALFVVFQRHMIQGIASTAVKG